MKRPEKMHTPKLFKNMKFVAYTDEMTPKINLQINFGLLHFIFEPHGLTENSNFSVSKKS